MPHSPDEAYDKAARKIWRAFVAAMWAPLPLILFQAWLRRGDRIQLYLLLGMALFWCALGLPYFLIAVRRGFRARSNPIDKASSLFVFPLLVFMRFPPAIVKDCGGGTVLELSAFGAVGALILLLCVWLGAIDTEYKAVLPPETSASEAELPSPEEGRDSPPNPKIV